MKDIVEHENSNDANSQSGHTFGKNKNQSYNSSGLSGSDDNGTDGNKKGGTKKLVKGMSQTRGGIQAK